METSRKWSEWIDAYSCGELRGKELKAFKKMAAKNALLRAEIQVDADLERFLADTGAIEFLDKLREAKERQQRKNPPANLLMLAASVVVLMTIGLFMDGGSRFSGNRAAQQDHKGSPGQARPDMIGLRQPGGGILISSNITPASRRMKMKEAREAARFEPLPEYELLVGGVARYAGFALLSPSTEVKCTRGQAITFRWMTPLTGVPVVIEVTDNRGLVIYTSPPGQGMSFNLATGSFRPGLYYFRIIACDELVKMGRIVLRSGEMP